MTAEHVACGVAFHKLRKKANCSWTKLLLLSSDEILSVTWCDLQFKLKRCFPIFLFLPSSHQLVFFFIKIWWTQQACPEGQPWDEAASDWIACMYGAFHPCVGSSAKLVWTSMKKPSMCKCGWMECTRETPWLPARLVCFWEAGSAGSRSFCLPLW